MKYKLLKDLPLAKAGTVVEISDTNFFQRGELDIHLPDTNGRPHCIANITLENQKEWLEEVKEPKTIYDLKMGDTYWWIDTGNQIDSSIVIRNNQFDEENTRYSFVTEREAKRNKLLRELATREKWLPEDIEECIIFDDEGNSFTFTWDSCPFIIHRYHEGLVFRNEEEYNKYMTEEAKYLLFNI